KCRLAPSRRRCPPRLVPRPNPVPPALASPTPRLLLRLCPVRGGRRGRSCSCCRSPLYSSPSPSQETVRDRTSYSPSPRLCGWVRPYFCRRDSQETLRSPLRPLEGRQPFVCLCLYDRVPRSRRLPYGLLQESQGLRLRGVGRLGPPSSA